MFTIGNVNKLTFEISEYRDQMCNSEWDDFLVIDVKYYSGDEIAFQYSLPYIMAREFAQIPTLMRDFIDSGEDKTVVDFQEPNIVFTLEKCDTDKYRVTAEIYMQYTDGNTIVKNQWFDEKGLREFIDTIEEEGRCFPPRIEQIYI